jgi:hypothetical protein
MARLAELLVALVLGAAGLLKIWDPPAFALSIARLGLMPDLLLAPAAVLIPWWELAGAVGLFLRPPWRAAGRAIAAGLLLAFTAALGLAWLRGQGAASCGCFGVEGGVWARVDVGFLRNLLLLILLSLGLRGQRAAGCGTAPASPARS